MSQTNNNSGGGIGFAGLLTIVFITLKLLGKIDWSWWWVLSPLWLGLVFAIVVVVLVLGVALVIALVKGGKHV